MRMLRSGTELACVGSSSGRGRGRPDRGGLGWWWRNSCSLWLDAFELALVVMLPRWPLVTDDAAPLSLPRLGSGHTRPYPKRKVGQERACYHGLTQIGKKMEDGFLLSESLS